MNRYKSNQLNMYYQFYQEKARYIVDFYAFSGMRKTIITSKFNNLLNAYPPKKLLNFDTQYVGISEEA